MTYSSEHVRFTPLHIGRGWQLTEHGELTNFTQGFFFATQEGAQEQCDKLNEEFSHATK